MNYSNYPNRTICAVLDDIRALDKTKNYSALLSLVEEMQMMANRMEAALWDQKDILQLREEISKLKKEKQYLLETSKVLKGESNEQAGS